MSAPPPDGDSNAAPRVYARYIRRVLQDMPQKFDPPTDGYLRFQGHDTSRIRPMGLNESLFPPSPRVLDAIRDNLSRIARYPDAQCPDVGKILSERTGIAMDRIVFGNGSEELIKGTISLATSPGDHVILPVPTFWGYGAMLRSAETRTSFVALESDGALDPRKVVAAIDGRTRLVICVTPNNPSGAMISKEDLGFLAREIPDDVLFFIDEAYHEFGVHAGGPDLLEILSRRVGPWIVARTFSKAYCIAGMRIGYAYCGSPLLADALRKTTCVFKVPILAQGAAVAALEDREHLARTLDAVARGREQLTKGFRGLGLAPLESVGNFVSVATPVAGALVAKEMFRLGVQIHVWREPGYENHIRVTIGQDEDNDACLAALARVLKAAR